MVLWMSSFKSNINNAGRNCTSRPEYCERTVLYNKQKTPDG